LAGTRRRTGAIGEASTDRTAAPKLISGHDAERPMSELAVLPLQFGALGTLPGILTTLVVVAVVILVARVLLSIAWRIVIVVAVIAAILWILGLLGPLSSLLGI
jgi:type IV secretory pathway VirB6-like protein